MAFSVYSTVIGLAILITLFLLAYFLLPITIYLIVKMTHKAKIDALAEAIQNISLQDREYFMQLYFIDKGVMKNGEEK